MMFLSIDKIWLALPLDLCSSVNRTPTALSMPFATECSIMTLYIAIYDKKYIVYPKTYIKKINQFYNSKSKSHRLSYYLVERFLFELEGGWWKKGAFGLSAKKGYQTSCKPDQKSIRIRFIDWLHHGLFLVICPMWME